MEFPYDIKALGKPMHRERNKAFPMADCHDLEVD